jgi:hypothetical protein
MKTQHKKKLADIKNQIMVIPVLVPTPTNSASSIKNSLEYGKLADFHKRKYYHFLLLATLH